jgi:hypothetical protein
LLPILCFVPKLPVLAALDKPCTDAWQGCRFAASQPPWLYSRRHLPLSFGLGIAHQAAAG